MEKKTKAFIWNLLKNNT